ncbi:MAG: hypothetical protein Phyf2KO_07790 [Phycisphaerales bacterium]
MTPYTSQHEFEHGGAWYEIHVELVTDHPAVYSAEVTRKAEKGTPRQSLANLTVRSDYSHTPATESMIKDSAFTMGEQIIRSTYL